MLLLQTRYFIFKKSGWALHNDQNSIRIPLRPLLRALVTVSPFTRDATERINLFRQKMGDFLRCKHSARPFYLVTNEMGKQASGCEHPNRSKLTRET